MSKKHVLWAVVAALYGFHAGGIRAEPVKWGPYTTTINVGSTDDSSTYSSINVSVIPGLSGDYDTGTSETEDADADAGAVPEALDGGAEGGGTEGDGTQGDDAERVPRRYDRHSIEIELGHVELDEPSDDELDVGFLSVGYKSLFGYGIHPKGDVLLYAGAGLGVYDASSFDPKVGFNVKFGTLLKLRFVKKADPYLAIDLGVGYHRIDSDLDFFRLSTGFRVHFPQRKRDRNQD